MTAIGSSAVFSRDTPRRGAGVGRNTQHFTIYPAPPRQEWHRLMSELHGFRRLERDWDGNGAAPPEPACIDAATQWLQKMQVHDDATPPTSVVPGVMGDVVFVWQLPGLFAEATVENELTVEWMIEFGSSGIRHFNTPIDWVPIIP